MGASNMECHSMIIRKKAVVILSIVIGLVIIFNLFFLNNVIKTLVTKGLETTFQTTIELDSARLKINPFGVVIHNLKIVDRDNPHLYQFESNRIDIALQLSELLNKRFIINKIHVLDIETATQRKFSQKQSNQPMSQKKVDASSNNQESDSEQQQTVSKHDADQKKKEAAFNDILSHVDLSGKDYAVKLADQFKQDQQKLTEFLSLDANKKTVKSLNGSLDNMLDSLKKADLKNIDQLKTNLKTIKNDANAVRQDLVIKKAHVAKMVIAQKKSVEKINTYFDQDYERLKQTIKLETYQSGNLSETLLKEKFSTQLETYLKYTQFTSRIIKNLSSSDHEKKQKEQKKGTTFEFQPKTPLPYFWIKSLMFSGKNETFTGKIYHLSTNQKLVGKPIRIQYQDKNKEIFASYFIGNVLTQVYSYTTEPIPLESYSIYGKEENNVMFDSAHQGIRANLKIVGKNLSGNVHFDTSKIQVSANQSGKLSLSSLIFDTLQHIDQISTTCALSGTILSPEIAISSDIDEIIKDRFNHVMQAEKDRQLNQLKLAIDTVQKDQTDQLMANINKDKSFNLNHLNTEDKNTKDLLTSIDKADQDSTVIKEKLAEIARQELERKKREAALALEKKKQEAALALEKQKREEALKLKEKQAELEQQIKDEAKEAIQNLF